MLEIGDPNRKTNVKIRLMYLVLCLGIIKKEKLTVGKAGYRASAL